MASTSASSIPSAPSKTPLLSQIVESRGGEFVVHNLTKLDKCSCMLHWGAKEGVHRVKALAVRGTMNDS